VADAAGFVKVAVVVADRVEEVVVDLGEDAGRADFEDALDRVGEVERGGFGVDVQEAGFLEVGEVFVRCGELGEGRVGFGGEFGLGGFGVEQEGLVKFGGVAGLDVDEALFVVVAVDVEDDVSGAVGEGGDVGEQNRCSGELEAVGGIEGAEAMVVEEEGGFCARDGLALSVAGVNENRAGVDGHGSSLSLAEVG